MISGHGGNIFQAAATIGCRSDDIIDMSSNMNPLGPPSGMVDYLIEQIDAMVRLPEPDAEGLVAAFSTRYALNPNTILAGSGTTQFIHVIPQALKCRRVLIIGPTYADYADACKLHGIPCDTYISPVDRHFNPDFNRIDLSLDRYDTVFWCNPNNPTGTLVDGTVLKQLCYAHPSVRFVVDESYLPFVNDAEIHSLMTSRPPNVIVLHSMSKIYRVPGLRVGFMVADEAVVQKIRPYLWPWRVSSVADSAARYVLDRSAPIDDFIATTRTYVAEEVRRLTDRLGSCKRLHPFPSSTVFVLIRLQSPLAADVVCSRLLKAMILARNCHNFIGLSPQYIRVSLKQPDINGLLIDQLTGMDEAP